MDDNYPADGQKLVLVCQFRTCKRDGSLAVLAELLAQTKLLNDRVQVQETGCLGLCGSGPIVMVCPGEYYYWQVRRKDVQVIVAQHLIKDEPVIGMLHPRLYPQS
jgi:(2Fe-2S) ferredoxin